MTQYFQITTDDKGNITEFGLVETDSELVMAIKDLLSKYSGIPRYKPTIDHVAAIRGKGYSAGRESAKDEFKDILAEKSQMSPKSSIGDHIAMIQMEAYHDGFHKGYEQARKDFSEAVERIFRKDEAHESSVSGKDEDI